MFHAVTFLIHIYCGTEWQDWTVFIQQPCFFGHALACEHLLQMEMVVCLQYSDYKYELWTPAALVHSPSSPLTSSEFRQASISSSP